MRIDLELPAGERTLWVDRRYRGQPLTAVLRQEQVPLNTRCGERLLCKSCMVEILRDGEWIAQPACRLAVDRDIRVRIPGAALLAYRPQVLSDYRINVSCALDPPFGKEGLAVAVDIGTTTVALSLISLATGEILATEADFNKQIYLGEDVLTRINLCLSDPAAAARLHRSIVLETLRPLISRMLTENGSDANAVKGYVLAGNTTMLHLAAGENPGTIGYAPFTPRFIEHIVRPSESVGLEPPGIDAHFLPGAASYVGADIVAGMFAAGIAYEEGPSMLVDVGTNGEIVLKVGDKMLACATAAGPAFEGCGLACGVRAGDGAISHVLSLEPEPEVETIGPPCGKPMGICGSAYIDFLALGRSGGLLGRNGRFSREGAGPRAERFESGVGDALLLARGQGKRPITISELDVARLLQAKAAIAAGILTLLRHAGIESSAVETLYLAGGFGMHLDLDHAVACGLLPGFREGQIQLVGNTSLAGATLACLDRGVLPELSALAHQVEIVELNLAPGFEDCYIDQLSLP